MATIHDCKVDPEFRDLIPIATWDERAELQASVERFGYLSSIVAWKNEAGQCLILDGHNRFESWKAACSNPDKSGMAASEPAVVVLDLPDRDSAMMFVINNQLGRRNIASVDRIMLVAKREQILKTQAKLKQSAAGQQSMFGRLGAKLLIKAPKAEQPIHTRKECAAEANVSEKVYADGKAVISAVAHGELEPEVIADIRAGKKSISGVARGLKGKPARKAKPKAKSSGWQPLIRTFSAAIRRVMKRSPEQRAEIAADLRRLADELELHQEQEAA